MSIPLPKLPNYIAVPDYPPHCPICGLRAIITGDFYHTNYKGGIYRCGGCAEKRTNLFIEQEDADFSLDYWRMSQKNRRVYIGLRDEEKMAYSKLTENSKKDFFKMKKDKQIQYMSQLISKFCLYFDLPSEYIDTLNNAQK